MSICLNMIVKNEANNLPRLFASLKDVVTSYVISDTGSTDNTIELIQELGNKYNISGIIIENEWVNFAHNRNIALNKAYELVDLGIIQATWFLIIDADEELINKNKSAQIRLDSNISYKIHKLYKEISYSTIAFLSLEQSRWHWEGSIHNFLVNDTDSPLKTLKDFYIKSHHFEGAKSKNFSNQREKSMSDSKFLEIEIAKNNTIEPFRYFIQGNEYLEFEENEKALIAYKKCLEKAHQKDLIYFSLIQIGVIYAFKEKNYSIGNEFFTKANKILPERKEGYYYLGKIAQITKKFIEAKNYYLQAKEISKIPYNDFLFDLSIYHWKVDVDLILVLNQLQEKKICLELINELEQKNHIPQRNMAMIKLLKGHLINQ